MTGILLIILGVPITIFILGYINYKKSTYFQETGTSYFKVVINKGTNGEYATYRSVKGIDENEKFLFNVYIPTGTNKWTEIDIIYINHTGIYVIENKNYSGWIYGNENNRTWTVTYNSKSKYKFYNPILQNKTHVSKVKEVLNRNNLNTSSIKSIICFNDDAVLKNITYTNPEIKIINSRDLKEAITENTQFKLNEFEINNIYEILKIYTNASDEIKQKHINNINNQFFD